MITLYDNEEIVAEVRRHWLPLAGSGIVLFLLAAFPFVAEAILGGLDARVTDALIHYRPHVLLLETAWVLLLWLSFAVAWTNHYLDILVITNLRIIDIEQIGLFSRDVAELHLEHIEDIRIEVPGFLADWLDFGNLEIQTAGENKDFALKGVERPEAVRAVISRVREEYLQKKRGGAQS